MHVGDGDVQVAGLVPIDVRLDGKPSTTGGTCPLVCTADLTEGVQTSALTNVQMWSFGPSPATGLSETHTLSYDLSITLGGMTVTEIISHDMKVDFYPVNINGLELLGLQMLDGPATTAPANGVADALARSAISLFSMSP